MIDLGRSEGPLKPVKPGKGEENFFLKLLAPLISNLLTDVGVLVVVCDAIFFTLILLGLKCASVESRHTGVCRFDYHKLCSSIPVFVLATNEKRIGNLARD